MGGDGGGGDEDDVMLNGQELKDLQASVNDLLSTIDQLLNDPFG